VKKVQRRGPSPSAPIGNLAVRADEALRQQRFKEAIELFKLMIRQDPKPEWKEALAEAYRGRARALAAKKMFKEAAMVLENTITLGGTVRDPRLYLTCLIRDGQQPKAAAYLLRCLGNDDVLPLTEQASFEALAAALLVAVPQLPEAPHGAAPQPSRWRELAIASREALASWINGTSLEDMDRQLNRISLRSAFRPIRLLLKSLITPSRDDERTRHLLQTISPDSPFYPFRQAVEAALLRESDLDASVWERLTPAQQAFVAETRGLPGEASQFLARLSEAERGGPAILFGYLAKQPELPQAEARSACLNLLPQIPDRLPQFEKSFGPLSDLERNRVKALAAEARGNWEAAERSWLAVARAIANGGTDRQAMLAQGVIYRHLAHLAVMHPEIEGEDLFGDSVTFYLERCYATDPDHIPTLLELIDRYRKESQFKDWHRLTDEAVQRFPDDSHVLLQATESAVARKAYKKAAGFARRLLQINSINPGVRRQMIELQVAHARKQMRAKRPDLAAKELSAAAEWERSNAPSAMLRIARGLVSLRTGATEQAEAWLRQGVDLSGGGVVGWFQARLEAELMKSTGGDAGWLHQELVRARETLPTKEAVMAIVSAVGQPEAGENKRAVAGLLLGMRAWLQQAAALDWSEAEFQSLAETFARFDAFGLLQEYVRAARQRDPANPMWRFHDIVARTKGSAERLSMAEMDDLFEIAKAAARREDFHAAKQIERFLGGSGRAPARRGRASIALPDTVDDDEMMSLFATMMDEMPKGSAADLRELVDIFGHDGAVAQMVDQLSTAPFGPGMPEPLVRKVCQALVAKAMDGGQSRPGQKARRSQFF
jgi:tetratricopeptide (TPR) repeat protein